MAIEIVDLPIDSMVIFHSVWYVYQRVSQASIQDGLFHGKSKLEIYDH